MNCDVNNYRDAVFPQFAEPTEIGHFSMSAEKDISFDKKQLKCLNVTFPPSSGVEQQLSVNFDLNEGYDGHISKATETGKIDRLLKFAVHRQKMSGETLPHLKSALGNADFLCYRGLLTRIASTVYSPKDSWILCVIKFQDVYFLCEFQTAKKQQEIAAMTFREKLMTYWGHRFEPYLLSSTQDAVAKVGPSVAMNLNEEYCSIVRTKLDNHRLVFGGEVDCVDPETNEYLELKTNRLIETPKHVEIFEKLKIVKWWLQSFLIGINTIICGFRNDSGVVSVLERMSVKDLVARGKPYWSGAVCFTFLSELLSVVKANVRNNDAKAVFRFEYDPVKRRVLFCRDNDVERAFLPDWFVNEFSV